jgi:hypothetical protein
MARGNQSFGSIALLLTFFAVTMPAAPSSAQASRPVCPQAPAPPPRPANIHNNPPPAPVLATPADGATTTERPVFRWDPVVDPEGDSVTFRIQIDDDPDFSTPNVDVWRGPETWFSPADALPPGTYCWRVRSIDDINAVSPYTRTFAVRLEPER